MNHSQNEANEQVTSDPSLHQAKRSRVPFEVVTEEVETNVAAVEVAEIESIPSIFADVANEEPTAMEQDAASDKSVEAVASVDEEAVNDLESDDESHFVDDEEDEELVEAFNAEEAILPFVEMGLSPAVLEAIKTAKGEWIRYSTPGPDGAEYIAVCLPAFAPDTVHRDGDGKG